MYDVPRGLDDDPGRAGGTGGSSFGQTTGGTKGESPRPPPDGSSGEGGFGGSSNAEGGTSAGGSQGSTAGDAGEAGEGGALPVPSDECPDDPNKVSPGKCGCGIPDDDPDTHTDCESLKSLIVHRYDFEDEGTTVTDRVGDAHGTVIGAASFSQVNGKGVLALEGGTNGGYVDLPNRLISTLTDVTIECWLSWNGGDPWQRIFDFGDSDASPPEDNPSEGKTYVFMTPRSEDNYLRAGYSFNNSSADVAIDAPPLAVSKLTQVVLVLDSQADKITVYVDGQSVGEKPFTGRLSDINDVNVWLGRSQFKQDPRLSGVFYEVRLYGAALNAAQVQAAFRAGPDPGFLEE